MAIDDAAAARAWQRRAAAVLAVLAVLELAWEWKLAPLRPGGSWLVLKALPVAWSALAVARHRPRALTLSSLVLLALFTEAVVRAASEPGRHALLAATAGVLTVAAFGALSLATRHARRAARRSG